MQTESARYQKVRVGSATRSAVATKKKKRNIPLGAPQRLQCVLRAKLMFPQLNWGKDNNKAISTRIIFPVWQAVNINNT